MLDYIRIGCAVPAVAVGNVEKNTQNICDYMDRADAQGVDLLVLPELALTGYTCGDLLLQDALHDGVQAGMGEIIRASARHPELVTVVGLPVRTGMKILNCAAVVCAGELVGMVSKTFLPNYGEGCESRWFSVLEGNEQVFFCGKEVCVGNDLLVKVGDALVGVEICEDLHSPLPPSVWHCLSGAEIIVNCAASPEQAGKQSQRNAMIKERSASGECVYAYCSAGYTESTSDLVFSGHSMICEDGKVLGENVNYPDSDYLLVRDCDLGKIRSGRRKNATFREAASRYGSKEMVLTCSKNQLRSNGAEYALEKLPFIPSSARERLEYCKQVFSLQVTGLKQRLQCINASPVIGISGGLDSTLALLVAVEAVRQLGRPLTDVYGVTMPCFGTSDRTYNNAWELMRLLGISCKEISIKDAVTGHFGDIGHDPAVHNATYENSQARERTQILMDYASTVNGIVVGTGDLSELALGWCTYNGDHMSMYSVNATIPKTLIRWIVEAVVEELVFAPAKDVLMDILDTPISPELLPPDAEGKISQQTEDLVGPYALHDFFLYHVLKYGFTPEKIYTLACRAFREDFDGATVKKWLKTFYRRFFTQQFKRNCVPDGVKACSLSLGPRGDWKMPSDASAKLWLDAVEKL